MMGACRVRGLAYLHFHLYLHMTNPTDHCSFAHLGNFMVVVVGLAHTNWPFLLPARYRFLDIYLVAFLWYPVPELAG
jgi:hypothetical protein